MMKKKIIFTNFKTRFLIHKFFVILQKNIFKLVTKRENSEFLGLIFLFIQSFVYILELTKT